MNGLFYSLGATSRIMFTLFAMLAAGFAVTRLTRMLRLPDVSGLIVAGILIGPQVLGLIPFDMASSMTFLSDLALAFIAFGVGKFFRLGVLRSTGAKTVVITIFESVTAGIFVTLAVRYVFRADFNFALLLGAIATATAPASTMMTIRQYKIKGGFVNTLLQVVALDDAVCLIVFSLAAAIVRADETGTLSVKDLLLPVIYNILALISGTIAGYAIGRVVVRLKRSDDRLILIVAALAGISGACAQFDVSPLLACMAMGMLYVNITGDKKLFRQLGRFTPPLMSLFFVASGMNLDLSALAAFGLVGVGYFAVRIVGKYAGAYTGCLVTGAARKTRNWLGVALIPQAGVAIGLAFLGQRMLPESTGNLLVTIILSSSVLYELIGPACGKLALFHSGSKIGASAAARPAEAPSEQSPETPVIEESSSSKAPQSGDAPSE